MELPSAKVAAAVDVIRTCARRSIGATLIAARRECFCIRPQVRT
jgi:hypothetical protein